MAPDYMCGNITYDIFNRYKEQKNQTIINLSTFPYVYCESLIGIKDNTTAQLSFITQNLIKF